jgi:hypothetical protein
VLFESESSRSWFEWEDLSHQAVDGYSDRGLELLGQPEKYHCCHWKVLVGFVDVLQKLLGRLELLQGHRHSHWRDPSEITSEAKYHEVVE